VMEVQLEVDGLNEAVSEILYEGGESTAPSATTTTLPSPPPSSSLPAPAPAPTTAPVASQRPDHTTLQWWPYAPYHAADHCPKKPWWHPDTDFTRRHKIQKWFGLDHFVLLLPQSYSRRFLVSLSLLSSSSPLWLPSNHIPPLFLPLLLF
jgi:hypothetical protein